VREVWLISTFSHEAALGSRLAAGVDDRVEVGDVELVKYRFTSSSLEGSCLNSFLFGPEALQLAVVMKKRLFIDFG
jgi:hypothetical protein